jgi:hypothetical protein
MIRPFLRKIEEPRYTNGRMNMAYNQFTVEKVKRKFGLQILLAMIEEQRRSVQ